MKKNYQLKSIRIKNRLTQRDIATMLGISVSTYCQKENGQRNFTLEEAWVIAQVLGRDIKEIFFTS